MLQCVYRNWGHPNNITYQLAELKQYISTFSNPGKHMCYIQIQPMKYLLQNNEISTCWLSCLRDCGVAYQEIVKLKPWVLSHAWIVLYAATCKGKSVGLGNTWKEKLWKIFTGKHISPGVWILSYWYDFWVGKVPIAPFVLLEWFYTLRPWQLSIPFSIFLVNKYRAIFLIAIYLLGSFPYCHKIVLKKWKFWTTLQ